MPEYYDSNNKLSTETRSYKILIDDSKTDIYDDTIIFYSISLDDEGSNLSIWCDYEGPTVSFTDFSNEDDENSDADSGLSEEFVREKLENFISRIMIKMNNYLI